MENMGPFQEAVSLAVEGVTDELLAKLPAEWPANLQGVAKALKDAGVPAGPKLVEQAKAVETFRPSPVMEPAVSSAAPEAAEIPEGGKPTEAQVSSFAAQLGLGGDMASMLMTFMLASGGGIGGDVDLGGLLPVTPQIIAAYNPKKRDIAFWFMSLVERRLGGTPLVVINSDGGVNADLSFKYIQSLEEGFDAAEDNIYYDEAGSPFEIIKVGVDAQSIYDADPVDPTRALQKAGMGTGRINWKDVPLDVRQVVFLAVTQTRELNPGDDKQLGWLRDNISPKTTRLNLRGEFPKALSAWNEARRMGALPTLRV